MKKNFDISLPSIPSNKMKFKIQDIKNTAFGSQKSRFEDMKSLLSSKFINSFKNFHQPKSLQIQKQPLLSLSNSDIIDRRQQKFRNYIPQHKNFLIPLFKRLKKNQINKSHQISPLHQGYTFCKSTKEQNSIQQNLQENYQTIIPETFTDNYYFNLQQKFSKENSESKVKPSPVFQNQTRQKQFQRMISSSITPGPGAYDKDEICTLRTIKRKINKSQDRYINKKNNKLIQRISRIIQVPEEQQIQQKIKLKNNNDHMFVIDDRDRFGNQIYPIAQRINSPGPGAYKLHQSIADKAKKVRIIEEQRKLLKQWYRK